MAIIIIVSKLNVNQKVTVVRFLIMQYKSWMSTLFLPIIKFKLRPNHQESKIRQNIKPLIGRHHLIVSYGRKSSVVVVVASFVGTLVKALKLGFVIH